MTQTQGLQGGLQKAGSLAGTISRYNQHDRHGPKTHYQKAQTYCVETLNFSQLPEACSSHQ